MWSWELSRQVARRRPNASVAPIQAAFFRGAPRVAWAIYAVIFKALDRQDVGKNSDIPHAAGAPVREVYNAQKLYTQDGVQKSSVALQRWTCVIVSKQ
jgi:hypothetical protein